MVRESDNRFEGLTKEEFDALIYFTYNDERSPILLSNEVDEELITNVKFFNHTVQYLRMIEERQPLKLTQKGNLPRKFCRELCDLSFVNRIKDKKFFQEYPLRSELDSGYIHTMNVLTQMSGFTRKKHNKFYLTKKCKTFLNKKSLSEMFSYLVSIYLRKYNWAYGYRFGPEVPFIQTASGFSVFLVHKYGGRVQVSKFYSDKFLQAFPGALIEFPGTSYWTPEEHFHHHYYSRTFQGFLKRFGLVIIGNEEVLTSDIQTIRKTALFDEFFVWRKNK
jgi:hypothetical protein